MGLFGKLTKKRMESDAADYSSKGGAENVTEEQLNEEKRDMIRGIEDLSETSVKEVMIPRIDVDFLSVGLPQDELLEKIAESGHSRFPVYSESIDNVIGVLYVKDLIAAFARHETVDLERHVRKAFFVPESKRIDSLLREFKRRHIHIAIAIDEYGGISGIVCMEDIIEEIVGDIQDEFDNEREDIISLGDNIWLCDARVNLDDLNETLGCEFPNEEFDTLGGFVFDLFGKIPIAYKSSYSCDSKLAEETIDVLINKRKSIKNAIIHSDQGVTYLSKSYIEKLSKLKVIRSNSKKGCPYDNACSENFFSIFKIEKLYRLGYIPVDKEEMDEIIEQYIDFYTNRRISISLGGLTPKEYYDNYIEKKKRLTKLVS